MVGMCILLEQKNWYSFTEFFIADNFQGQGFAYEAAKCIIDKFKSERKYSTIKIYVHETNTIALHVYEKAGFKKIGNPEWGKDFWVLELEM